MNLRSGLRSLYIRTAVAAGLDRVALSIDRRRGSRGVVIAMHETPMALEAMFRRQLEWVARRFQLVSLEEFGKLWDRDPNSARSGKPFALFTFDDGRESNYSIAAPLLESFGARGVFFVVPAFAECPAGEALSFYRSRVNPDSRPGDEAWEDWKPMTPRQIADLAARGHAIGSHTLSHARLAGLSQEELDNEVGESARKLSSWTGRAVEAFASTFAWDSVDAAAWRVIRRYHTFCFTPCSGVVDTRHDIRLLIWRREIEARYTQAEFRFFYSGLGDFAWAERREKLRQVVGAEEPR